jgi:type I restriction enzyme M protein
MGAMIDRAHRELTDADIEKIAGTYHAWRGDASTGSAQAKTKYADVPGFCKSATLDEIRSHNYVLTPGRYVGAEEIEEDDEAFEDKMQRLTKQLYAQMAEGEKLDVAIKKNLKELGFVG